MGTNEAGRVHYHSDTKSIRTNEAAPTLKGLKFISKTDRNEWPEVEKMSYKLTASTNGLLPCALFGECIAKLGSPVDASNPKSKLTRKPHMGLSIRDFIFANFFIIDLSISLFLFLIVILRYGVPIPLSTHFKSKSSTRFSKPRKPVSSKPDSGADVAAGAIVDITDLSCDSMP
ncbi:hypothetical protein FF2_024847 [Malus domestica]